VVVVVVTIFSPSSCKKTFFLFHPENGRKHVPPKL
jgi:hypothetical protein